MDLSIKTAKQAAEVFDYRHKKFDQVRTSPLTVTMQEVTQVVYPATQHEADFYRTTQAQLKCDYRKRDHEWELEMDDVNRPSTPLKTRRISKRKLQNSTLDACPNAPKKRKVPLNTACDETPTKSPPATLTYAAPNLPVLMPKISNEALARICQYNKNMVRKFPKKERSAKDQERRDKNTIACRMSRRLKKLENLAIEEQYKIFVQEHLEHQKRCMQASVYLNELIKCGAQIPIDDELNNEFMQTIAKNFNLRFLQKCLFSEHVTMESLASNGVSPQVKTEDFDLLSQELIDVGTEQDQHAAQLKRPFTIAFLLGAQQKC